MKVGCNVPSYDWGLQQPLSVLEEWKKTRHCPLVSLQTPTFVVERRCSSTIMCNDTEIILRSKNPRPRTILEFHASIRRSTDRNAIAEQTTAVLRHYLPIDGERLIKPRLSIVWMEMQPEALTERRFVIVTF